jgi:hypothetical protein
MFTLNPPPRSEITTSPHKGQIHSEDAAQFGISEIGWAVQAHPNGPFLNLTGTLEEVIGELRNENPNFDDDFALGNNGIRSQKLQVTECFGSEYNCWTFGECNRSPVLGGSEYLKGLSGEPSNGPGPGNCGRVSCSYGSAIYWCNDVCCSGQKAVTN